MPSSALEVMNRIEKSKTSLLSFTVSTICATSLFTTVISASSHQIFLYTDIYIRSNPKVSDKIRKGCADKDSLNSGAGLRIYILIYICAHKNTCTHAYTQREVCFHINGQKVTQITDSFCGRKTGAAHGGRPSALKVQQKS